MDVRSDGGSPQRTSSSSNQTPLREPAANAAPLLELWRQFGVWCSLTPDKWKELSPVLDRLPPLDLANPRVDEELARQAIEKHLRKCKKRFPRRRIRWFSDSNSAHAYTPAVHRMAPCFSNGPEAFQQAWDAGGALSRRWRGRDHTGYGEFNVAPPIEDTGTLLELFAAGVFYYWIRRDEVLCIRRPSLHMLNGWLHRADGPAVEWLRGERYYFWKGRESRARLSSIRNG